MKTNQRRKGTPTPRPPKGNTEKWYTRRVNFDPLNEEFGFTVDACADSREAAKCERFICPPDLDPDEVGAIAADGLTTSWEDEIAWVNPGPYNAKSLARWAKKCSEEARRARAIVLAVPMWPDRGWFQDYIKPDLESGAAELRLPRGRWRFGWPGCPDGRPGCGGKFPQALVIWRRPEPKAAPTPPVDASALQAELQREREARIRLEGFREAVELLVMAGAASFRRSVTERDTSAIPHVSGSVTSSVTQEERERQERRREQARRRQQNHRSRNRSKSSSPSPSAKEERGALVAVSATAQRDARDGHREHHSPETLPPEARALCDAWNELVAPHGFPRWERTSRALLRDVLAALNRRPLEEWRLAFALMPRSPVCRGELSSRQRASLVWMLVGQTREGYEPAECLLSGRWSLDPAPEAEQTRADPPEDPPQDEGAPAALWRRMLSAITGEGRTYALEWLVRMKPVGIEEDGVLVLECPDRFFRDWVQDHYQQLLEEHSRAVGLAGVGCEVQHEVTTEGRNDEEEGDEKGRSDATHETTDERGEDRCCAGGDDPCPATHTPSKSSPGRGTQRDRWDVGRTDVAGPVLVWGAVDDGGSAQTGGEPNPLGTQGDLEAGVVNVMQEGTLHG